MRCEACRKEVKEVSDELWGKCKACAKAWVDTAMNKGWTDVLSENILSFAGIKTPYADILDEIRERKLHKARMSGKMIAEMKK